MVNIGSRTPGRDNVSVEEAFNSNEIIFLAIPFQFVSSLPFDKLRKGQIIVDCSNRSKVCSKDELSQVT